MHIEIVRGLRIRHAPLFDQPHRLKLELACKLPSLHDSPPVPSKHLTRCPRNRVQATWKIFFELLAPEKVIHVVDELLVKLKEFGPLDQKVILTVSPVPFTRTFSGSDAVVANCYSKSVLRTAA